MHKVIKKHIYILLLSLSTIFYSVSDKENQQAYASKLSCADNLLEDLYHARESWIDKQSSWYISSSGESDNEVTAFPSIQLKYRDWQAIEMACQQQRVADELARKNKNLRKFPQDRYQVGSEVVKKNESVESEKVIKVIAIEQQACCFPLLCFFGKK